MGKGDDNFICNQNKMKKINFFFNWIIFLKMHVKLNLGLHLSVEFSPPLVDVHKREDVISCNFGKISLLPAVLCLESQ